MGSKHIDEAKAAQAGQGLHYREITGGLIMVRGEVRTRKPQPEVVVKLDLPDGDADVIKELLGTPSLEFCVSAIESEGGTDIVMRIRLKRPAVVDENHPR